MIDHDQISKDMFFSEKLSSMEDIVSLMENKPDGFEASEKTKSYLFDLVLLLNKKEKKVDEIIPN